MIVQNVAEASTHRTAGIDAHASALDSSAPATAAPGFRHFLGTPLPSQRFRIYGIDPLASPSAQPELRKLMKRLSRRMDAAVKWPAHRDERL